MLPTSFPPTPEPSIHTRSKRGSPTEMTGDRLAHGNKIMPDPATSFPPTPPSHDFSTSPPSGSAAHFPLPAALDGLALDDSSEQYRTRRARRPFSSHPASNEGDTPYQSRRKYTDPTPHSRPFQDDTEELSMSSQQLDVDLDAYSTTDYDGDESGFGGRAPTLSFVTTATGDSTASTPSIGAGYGGFKPDPMDGKMDGEPRIRLRATAGRSNAYSSAESSMASGAYSAYSIADNHGFHPHPPPLPVLPAAYAHEVEKVGLGIQAIHQPPFSQAPLARIQSQASQLPASPSAITSDYPSPSGTSFKHRPWKRDVHSHLRSDSASSSSSSIRSEALEYNPDVLAYRFNGYNLSERLPWEVEPGFEFGEEKSAKALISVEEGQSKTLDAARVEALGGVEMLSPEALASMGITHLLLSAIGTSVVPILPALIEALAPTLLVIDLSDNDLTFVPETLRQCGSLEEINISGNPIRQLPAWMGDLTNLHVLVVDGCGLQILPGELSRLGRLHTLCTRRNRLVSLPSWLCLLARLETLRVDDNPFAPEWIPVVAPILAGPNRGVRPPFQPKDTASTRSGIHPAESTVSLSSSLTSSSSNVHSSVSAPSLGEMRSSSAAQSSHQIVTLQPIAEDFPHSAPMRPEPSGGSIKNRSLRKMRSAGALLKLASGTADHLVPVSPAMSPLPSASSATSAISSSSSTLIPPQSGRFNSLGASHARRASDALSVMEEAEPGLPSSGSHRSSKWGFLRKMSMHRLRDKDRAPSIHASASSNIHLLPPPLQHTDSEPGPARPPRPELMTAHTAAVAFPTRRALGLDEESEDRMETLSAQPSFGLPPPPSRQVGKRGKRRSFLPIDPTPPSINILIPSASPFMPSDDFRGPAHEGIPTAQSEATIVDETMTASSSMEQALREESEADCEAMYAQGLESIKSYLKDMFDLSRPLLEPHPDTQTPAAGPSYPGSPASGLRNSVSEKRRRALTMEGKSRCGSSMSAEAASQFSNVADEGGQADFGVLNHELENVKEEVEKVMVEEEDEGKKFKNDRHKRARVIREIYETERTYVRGMGELVNIYVRPSAMPAKSGSPETVVPVAERKIVFGGIESILSIHRENLLPALEKAVQPLLEGQDDEDGSLSTQTAHSVGEVFRTYIAYMKQYSTYINNFDNALSRMKSWTANSTPGTPVFGKNGSPTVSSIAGLTATGAAASVGMTPAETVPHSGMHMTPAQKKRVKGFLKRCREHPMHSQINLESYLLLPVQRVPRYRLLLEDLALCTPTQVQGPRDTLDDAMNEIAGLASLMNEEKRDAESRLRLYHWQKRISSRGPSPLVQPHRKLVLDGALTLIRLVKKSSTFVEIDNCLPHCDAGDMTVMPQKVVVPVEYIQPEPMDRQMMLILCTDLMVLVQQRIPHLVGDGGWEGMVDLYNVMRMGTLREPASVVHGDVLRVVDNKSIYYFSGTSSANVLEWCRAINSARKR